MVDVTRRQLLLTSAAAGFGALGAGVGIEPAFAGPLPSRVDLRGNQTPIRDQAGRNSCIVFAGIAALEAAVRRTYRQSLDLSEEFANFLGKALWLEPNYANVLDRGPDGAETQLAWASGGGGVWVIEWLSKGFRVPLEMDMPYVPNETQYRNRWAQISRDPFPDFPQIKQRRVSDFNTKTAFLPRDLLYLGQRQDWWWSATGFTKLTDRSVLAIQRVLLQGFEVVCDFGNIARRVDAFGIWQPGPGNGGAHAMLIVGYDFSHSDPARHYFIVKNSWGPEPRHADGFTRISPAFLTQRVTGAGFIRGAQRTNWPLLPILGRWKLNDVHERTGTLDIYHIPPLAKPIWDQWPAPTFTGPDRRIGTYYTAGGDAYKVNGVALAVRVGTRWVTALDLYIYSEQSPPYDRIGGNGRRYILTLGHNRSDIFSGYSILPGTNTRRSVWAVHEDLATSYSPRGSTRPQPFTARTWLGTRWKVDITIEPNRPPVGIDVVFDNRVINETSTTVNMGATLIDGARRTRRTVPILKADPLRALFAIPAGWGGTTTLAGQFDMRVDWRDGIATGTLRLDNALGGVIWRGY